jgi:hypothetical protein
MQTAHKTRNSRLRPNTKRKGLDGISVVEWTMSLKHAITFIADWHVWVAFAGRKKLVTTGLPREAIVFVEIR